jgi:hypothetical protein
VANGPLQLSLGDGAVSLEQIAESFALSLRDGQELVVSIPLTSIGYTNSYLDITEDFSFASFAAESLGRLAQTRALDWKIVGAKEEIQLHLSGFIAATMATELARMSLLFDMPEQQFEALQEEYESLLGYAADHQESLATCDLIFPELADLYFINLLHGGYYEWEPEQVAEALRTYPEHRYGFFRSRDAESRGAIALCSTAEWIFCGDVDVPGIEQCLHLCHEELLPGSMFMTSEATVFTASHGAVTVPVKTLLNALACGDDYIRRTQKNEDTWDALTFQGAPAAAASAKMKHAVHVQIGEFHTRALLRCEGFSVLFLDVANVSGDDRKHLSNLLTGLGVLIGDGEPDRAHISVPWSEIDDEKFEQICYDFLFAHPDFDKHRIEKVGKSRSRDGGRDIVAWTMQTIRSVDRGAIKRPLKYVFQCKHINATGSLTPRHISAIADTLEQYSADGYGVMCCGYIDATLHDRVDAISRNRQLAPALKIDRFMLERFLARRPHLVERYF